ncbi:hypothetical protein GVX76_09910 [[Haemophilus] felis]|nr:hypothetical protein [[Haemophilus] felis]
MKLIGVLSLVTSVLVGCSFGGFKPATPYFSWRYPGSAKYFGPDENIMEFMNKRDKDMRSCGVDPVYQDAYGVEPFLCLEKKGWYLEGGPVCEVELMWDQELCIAWRKKHSKPDVKPWKPKREAWDPKL